MRFLIPLLFLLLACTSVRAQRVLLFERTNKPVAERVYAGEDFRFRLVGDDFWQEGPIRELRPDIQALVINDRYIMLDEIESVHRGSTFFAAAGYSMMTFSVAWTGIGLVGYATDKDPSTNFTSSDVTIAVTSMATGYLLNRFLGQRKYKLSEKKRLRIIDTSF